MKLYYTGEMDASAESIRREFRRLEGLEGVSDEQERGRLFDYLIALLLSRVDGVECAAKVNMERGEVDVLADFTGTEKRLHRLTGNIVPVENKWECKVTKQREIHIQHRKAELVEEMNTCHISLFVSMGGFAKDAHQEIQRCKNPNMVGLEHRNVVQLIESDDIEATFRAMIEPTSH